MLSILFEQKSSLLGYLIVGICWGVTNPFIKRATMTKALENASSEGEKGVAQSHRATLRQFCTEPRIFLPFLVNQSGSIVYYLLLSKEPISKAAPICNALTFILTAITGYVFLKEEIRSPLLLATGSFLVLCGIYLCCSDFEIDDGSFE
jgi:drug/metabolite transporter (DMT)-like permease